MLSEPDCTGTSEIAAENIESLKTGMIDFFGRLPQQLYAAFNQPIRYTTPSGFAPIFRRFLPARSHADFAAFLQDPSLAKNPELSRVAASFRALDGCDPSVFLQAARLSQLRTLDIASPTTIITQVQALPSRQSIFDDANRIAMPDETLLFGGGSARDLALLFHVALERTGATVTTSITASDAFVQADGMTWSMTTLTEAAPPRGNDILLRWAD